MFMTLRDAFAFFDGAKGRNPRWSWSARSTNGRTVVLTLWKHDIDDDGATIRVHWRGRPGRKRLGYKELIENLIWARDHCGGLFHIVMIVAKDPNAQPRSIAKCWPDPGLVMKLSDLDETTGEFRAESVSR